MTKKILTKNNIKKGKLIQKKIFESYNNSKYLINNSAKEENKINFDNNKKKIELIKKQYINSTIRTHEIKFNYNNNMRKILYHQDNILDLKDISINYPDLIKDNLFKYRKENQENLKIYKSKKENQKLIRRPLSYNPNAKNIIKDKEKKTTKRVKQNDNNKKRKRCMSAENIKREEIKQMRENLINKRVLSVFKNDDDNNNIGKCLDYYNNLLKENQDKKNIFYNQLDFKSKQIENNWVNKSHSCPYRYGINLNNGYNNQNIDKTLHIKYIYHSGSEINQNLYFQKMNESDKNYYINSYVYKRKNKFH